MLKTYLLFVLLAMISPERNGVAASAGEATIDGLFRDFSNRKGPGASVLISRDGKILLAKSYGSAEVEANIPCSTNTNFRLASVTKQFTAMAIMVLADRNRLRLDNTLTDFFPEFPAYGRPVAVRHLLTHTSGLVDYEDVIPKGTVLPVLDRDVLRLMMQQQGGYFPPGTKFRYSNSGFALLALIVEKVSGTSFANFLQANIFRPLKMNGTLAYEEGLSVVPLRAYGYSSHRAGFQRTDQSLTSSVLGDGGIYSSVLDLHKWDEALYGTQLVSGETMRAIFSPAIATDKPGVGYGFGWFIGSYRGFDAIWHSGNTIGFTTRIARFPQKRFTVIVLSNRNEASLAELVDKIVDLYLFSE